MRRMGQLARLGVPMAISIMVEVGLFSAVSLLMGSLGVVAVAAHQIALNYSALAFMVPLGMAMGITSGGTRHGGAGYSRRASRGQGRHGPVRSGDGGVRPDHAGVAGPYHRHVYGRCRGSCARREPIVHGGLGPQGLGAGLVFGLTTAAVLLSLRFHRLTRRLSAEAAARR